jgi:hypothetical protein
VRENDLLSYMEDDPEALMPDPDEVPLRDRRVVTKPYDLVVLSMIEQIKNGTIFLQPLSDRPSYQRRYVWTDKLASRLIESIILNVPIPPIFLSQNEEFEFDVIDGQQRIYSIFRFYDNQFPLRDLEVATELNGLRFFELPQKTRRQIETHTVRCVYVTNESHPDIKFEVFQRLNTNTAPLNAQELRNCIFRGPLNSLLKECAASENWLKIVGKRQPDKRMRDEEVVLRYFSFFIHGVKSYRTPLKQWLNDTAEAGKRYSEKRTDQLRASWDSSLQKSLIWFEPDDCFRRTGSRTINKALFDLVMASAGQVDVERAAAIRTEFRKRYREVVKDPEFEDLISRAVDHTKRTKRRFEIWQQKFAGLLG